MSMQRITFFKFLFLGPPNITTSFESNIKNRSVTLIGNLYFLDNSPEVHETFWTKNDERINTKGSGGKVLEMSIKYPALIIRNVSTDDAGEYRLTAINAIGSSTSDVIVLGILVIYFAFNLICSASVVTCDGAAHFLRLHE